MSYCLFDRYTRAVSLTAPKLAVSPRGLLLDGYWISERHFYYLSEQVDHESGLTVPIPSLADATSGTTRELLPIRLLQQLLSTASGKTLGMEQFLTATFDARDLQTLGITVNGVDYVVDVSRRAVISMAPSLNVPALYSPDGRYACYLDGYNLSLRELGSGVRRPITTAGVSRYGYGRESETGLAAVAYRERATPVGVWSPDSAWFFTFRIDERNLPELPLVQNHPPGGGRPRLHTFKYPYPGDPLPIVIGVAIHISGRVLEFGEFASPLTAFSLWRRAWFDRDGAVWWLQFDRYCKKANLVRLDLESGRGAIVLSEVVDHGYLEPHPVIVGTPNVRVLTRSQEIIWYSERDGWGHLYLYDARSGKLKNQITGGNWLVRDLVEIDERRREVLFLAGGVDPDADPSRRMLCKIGLDGSHFQILARHDGDVFVSPTEPCGTEQDRPFRPAYAPEGISPDGRYRVIR